MRALLVSTVLAFGIITPAGAREAATLACSGTEVVTSAPQYRPNSATAPGGSWSPTTQTSTGFNFTIDVDPAAQTITLNGRPMTVRQFDGEVVVFSRQKTRFMSTLIAGGDYSLNRRTGIIRFPGGSGQCRRVENAPIF